MKPFFFGPPASQLYGVYHHPLASSEVALGVLLCDPFGHEAVQAHRILRALASRLAKAGFHVLRFSYFATGDSAGEGSEGTQAQWVDDVGRAHEELVRLSGAVRVAWVGLRYGGSLALLASRAAAPDEVVLWDPVVRGDAYLNNLARGHLAFMKAELPTWKPAPTAANEALGFPLPPRLRAELGELDLTAVTGVRARRVTLLCAEETQPLAELRATLDRSGVPVRPLVVSGDSAWASDEAMNAQFVPTALLNAIVKRLQELE